MVMQPNDRNAAEPAMIAAVLNGKPRRPDFPRRFPPVDLETGRAGLRGMTAGTEPVERRIGVVGSDLRQNFSGAPFRDLRQMVQ